MGGHRMRRIAIRRLWATTLATALSLAGFAYTWFGPAGTTCIGQSGGVQHCFSTTLASGVNPPVLATALLASAAFYMIPLILRRVTRVLWGGVG